MTETLGLDIAILLPDVPDAADACVDRLIAELEGHAGIGQVHVAAGEPARLCVHFDPAVVSLPRIRELAQGAGARLTERYGHAIWPVEGITHERRARTVAERLGALPGVLEAQASASGVVRIEFDRNVVHEPELAAALAGMGVTPAAGAAGHDHAHDADAPHAAVGGRAGHDHEGAHHDHHGHDHHGHAKHDHAGHGHGERAHDHAHGGFLGPNTELIFALACGAVLAIGFAVETLTGAPEVVARGIYLLAYVFGGFYTVREALDNLRLRRFEIDTLMLVAAAGAAALGAFAEGALLLFLFSLGHALEHYAMGRAKQAITALAELAPRTATVRRDGGSVELPVEDLAIGDVVIVRPHARLPADGFVVAGASAVDQAPVTGESIPVDKRPVADAARARQRPDGLEADARVFAGTINGAGALEVEVIRRAADSTLARVVQMVSEAETQKSPTQRFTDRFERIFVPAVLGGTLLLLFAWTVVDEPFSASFYRAMAVLVAASPCALAIATPSAVLSGVARAARGGVLVKGGAPLEHLGGLSAIAFDKTGTLTTGRPQITDVVPAPGVAVAELLEVAVAVETLSDHPLAAAIVRDGRGRLDGRDIPEARDLESLTGRGVTATLAGARAVIGKAEMFGRDGIPPLGPAAAEAVARLREAGRTTMAVRLGARDLGVIGLMDTLRPEAEAALTRLRALGITRMVMISGDHQKVAEAVGREAGMDEAIGDLMPEDKVAAIRALRAAAEVAMVGDGVNDAPAMANATVGIAMGAAGSDVALETADVALMADDLRHLPFAVGLSRHTRGIIRQNVVISLGVVALLVPATLFGLGIGPAVAAHEGSTLVVVFNALRLLRYRDPGAAAV